MPDADGCENLSSYAKECSANNFLRHVVHEVEHSRV
jgi:hypothetical protein